MCHGNQDSSNMIRATSAREELPAMAIEQKHLNHRSKYARFTPLAYHVEPVFERTFNGKGDDAKQTSSCHECGDCKDAYCCKRANSCIQPKGYSKNNDANRDFFSLHKDESLESYNIDPVHRILNSDEECSEEKWLHYCANGNQIPESNPKNPGESSELLHTDNKRFSFDRKCDYECKNEHLKRETSHNAQDIKHSPNCSASQLNDNNWTHPYQTDEHESRAGRETGFCNEFTKLTLCEDKNSKQTKHWKLGVCGNFDSKSTNDCKCLPN